MTGRAHAPLMSTATRDGCVLMAQYLLRPRSARRERGSSVREAMNARLEFVPCFLVLHLEREMMLGRHRAISFKTIRS